MGHNAVLKSYYTFVGQILLTCWLIMQYLLNLAKLFTGNKMLHPQVPWIENTLGIITVNVSFYLPLTPPLHTHTATILLLYAAFFIFNQTTSMQKLFKKLASKWLGLLKMYFNGILYISI